MLKKIIGVFIDGLRNLANTIDSNRTVVMLPSMLRRRSKVFGLALMLILVATAAVFWSRTKAVHVLPLHFVGFTNLNIGRCAQFTLPYKSKDRRWLTAWLVERAVLVWKDPQGELITSPDALSQKVAVPETHPMVFVRIPEEASVFTVTFEENVVPGIRTGPGRRWFKFPWHYQRRYKSDWIRLEPRND